MYNRYKILYNNNNGFNPFIYDEYKLFVGINCCLTNWRFNMTDQSVSTSVEVEELMLVLQNSLVELNCQLITEIHESDNIGDNTDRIKICSRVDQMFDILNSIL